MRGIAPEIFITAPGLAGTISDLLRHRFNELRNNSYWVTSRSNALHRNKAQIYYASIKQRERNCFRQINL